MEKVKDALKCTIIVAAFGLILGIASRFGAKIIDYNIESKPVKVEYTLTHVYTLDQDGNVILEEEH